MTHSEILATILTTMILASVLTGFVLGYWFRLHMDEREGGHLDAAYEEGMAAGRNEYASAIRSVRSGDMSGYELGMVNRYSPELLADAADIHPAPAETVIGSHGYKLVPVDAEVSAPEPEYVPDTWLQDRLADGREWLSRETDKQLRWRNKVPRHASPERIAA
jgi:hypothetical protein